MLRLACFQAEPCPYQGRNSILGFNTAPPKFFVPQLLLAAAVILSTMRFQGGVHMAIAALQILPLTSHVYALDLDIDNQGKGFCHRDIRPPIVLCAEWLIILSFVESVKDAGSTAAYNMMTWYKPFNGTDNPGFISRSWWTGAALYLACLNYWHATNDTTYNEDVSIGLQHQGGEGGDYLPSWAKGVVSVHCNQSIHIVNSSNRSTGK